VKRTLPIKTIEVGVAVFSLTLNNSVIIENVHMSKPEPAKDVKIPKFLKYKLVFLLPPTKPVAKSISALYGEKFGIWSKVFRLYSLFNIHKATANADHIETKNIFFCSAENLLSSYKKMEENE
jgi:hypothetical protein